MSALADNEKREKGEIRAINTYGNGRRNHASEKDHLHFWEAVNDATIENVEAKSAKLGKFEANLIKMARQGQTEKQIIDTGMEAGLTENESYRLESELTDQFGGKSNGMFMVCIFCILQLVYICFKFVFYSFDLIRFHFFFFRKEVVFVLFLFFLFLSFLLFVCVCVCMCVMFFVCCFCSHVFVSPYLSLMPFWAFFCFVLFCLKNVCVYVLVLLGLFVVGLFCMFYV